MRSGIVFLISFCLLSTTCIQQRQKLETKECSTTQADTSFIVVDSTLLLYLKKNTSDKEIYAVLEERPEYPGGMKEAIKYIQTHIQYPPAAIYKKIQGRVWIESGDPYRITYEDQHGVWRTLPIHTVFNSIAYSIQPGKQFLFKANLNPNVLPNRPGRYRFFYEVELMDKKQKITLMTEFRLADIKEAVRDSSDVISVEYVNYHRKS